MKKLRTIILLLCALPLCFAGCQGETSDSFFAMDTYMSVKVYGSEQAVKDIRTKIETLDRLLSPSDGDSEIFRLNRDKTLALSDDTASLLQRSLQLCRETDGALDITLFPIVEEWGFISKEYRIPTRERLDKLLEQTGTDKVQLSGSQATLTGGARLDCGAVAKGYAADAAAEILRKEQVGAALLNLGGTVLAFGSKPDGSEWSVGLADPQDSASYFAVLRCRDKVVATSGGYERYFIGDDGKKYCHIIDPSTGMPADNHVTSVSVICADGTEADALSTALFVMGSEKAEAYYREHGVFDYVMLLDDGSVSASEGIIGSLQLTNGGTARRIDR